MKQILVIFLNIISTLMGIYSIILIGSTLEALNADFTVFRSSLVRLSIVTLSYFLTYIFTQRAVHLFNHQLLKYLRKRLFSNLLKKETEYFDNHKTGAIVNDFLETGNVMALFAGSGISRIIIAIINVTVILYVMIERSLELSAIIFVIIPIYYLLFMFLNKKIMDAIKRENKNRGQMTQQVIESIQGITAIKTFNSHQFFLKKFNYVNNNFYLAIKKSINLSTFIQALSLFVGMLLPVATLIYGSILVYNNIINVPTLISFYLLIETLKGPIDGCINGVKQAKQAVSAYGSIKHLLYVKPNSNNNKVVINNVNEIKISINSYSINGISILKKINQNINRGDIVQIKGESGSGKTSLLNLLANLYPISDGFIEINGIKINNIKNIYQFMSVITQNSFVFNGTIKENILLNESVNDDSLIYASLIKAGLGEFMKDKNLDYIIGENGNNLSGGERQRLCLARIIIRNPQIILLDEATSALDKESSTIVLTSLKEYLDKTKAICFLITHNENEIIKANKIIEV